MPAIVTRSLGLTLGTWSWNGICKKQKRKRVADSDASVSGYVTIQRQGLENLKERTVTMIPILPFPNVNNVSCGSYGHS